MPKAPNYWIPPLPPLEILRRVDACLARFFDHYQIADFKEAEKLWFDWYDDTVRPKTSFYCYIDGGTTGGRTFEDGGIRLQHPEDWKRSKNTSTKRPWVRMVIHEWAHFLLWSHEEEKAEKFERLYASRLREKS